MVTSEEIARVPLFASLAPAERERLSRRPRTSASPPGSSPCTRAGSARCSPCSPARSRSSRSSTGSSARSAGALPGAIFGEVPMALGTPFPGGYRAAEPSRVMRVERAEYYALAAAVARSVAAGGRAGARAHRRAAEHRRRAAAGRASPGRSALGSGVLPTCAGSSPATRSLRLADARRAGSRRGFGRRRSPAGWRLARRCARGRRRVLSPRRCATLPSASACRPRPRVGRLRRRHHRRRAGGPRGGGLRRVRRAAHDRHRARGARRPGRDVVADRELSRLSQRRLGRRACQPRAAAGAAARRGNPGHALGHRHRSGDARRFISTAAT